MSNYDHLFLGAQGVIQHRLLANRQLQVLGHGLLEAVGVNADVVGNTCGQAPDRVVTLGIRGGALFDAGQLGGDHHLCAGHGLPRAIAHIPPHHGGGFLGIDGAGKGCYGTKQGSAGYGAGEGFSGKKTADG